MLAFTCVLEALQLGGRLVKRIGALLIVVGSAFGLAIAVYNFLSPTGFLSPLSDTAGTPGAMLVIGSCLLMLLVGLLLVPQPRNRLILFLGIVGVLLDIIGTGFAALLLESAPLLAAMGVAALGWLAWIFGRRRRAAV
jgi:hypothetical protein